MNKMKQKNSIYFFFSLICVFLLSVCFMRKFDGFHGEDAHFANYTLLGSGSNGLDYYYDEDNPSKVAVALGSCDDQDIEVADKFEGKDVTEVFPAGFQNCDTVKTITLPDTIDVFGTDAFAGSSIVSMTIPKDLEVISSGAFRSCTSLTTVKFKNDNQIRIINDYAFSNCYKLVTFPFHELKHLTTIGEEAFLYCLGLTDVVFPESFTTLESYAFQDCKGLTTIYFAKNIRHIGANAFRGVGESAKIYFSNDRPTTVSNCSFSDPDYYPGINTPFEDEHNFSFGDYYIPITFGVGDMKFVGDYQFTTPKSGEYGMKRCTTGSAENAWTYDPDDDEYTDYIAEDEVVLMTYTGTGGNIDIPPMILGAYKVVGIASEVFKNKNITGVTFHENLRFIDYGAFRDNTNLTNIDLRDAIDLQHIQSRAFYNTMTSSGGTVGSLYSVHIPSNVVNIGPDAFRSCDGLWRLFFDGATDEYEEVFLCPTDGAFSFDLAYDPASISSVTFDGPALTTAENEYSVSGRTITIAEGRTTGVARVKYTTKNNIATQTFTGGRDDSNDLISEFVLVGRTDSSSIDSVTVNDNPISPSAYAISDYDEDDDGEPEKSKITFNNPPRENDVIVVTYRGQSKLKEIGDYAFYGCSKFGNKSFYGTPLRQADNPFTNVYFPASLNTIGKYAFASGQFIGGVTFQSMSLTISEYAFSEQKSLSSIDFPSEVTSLSLGQKCFASGLGLKSAGNNDPSKWDWEAAAGDLYKKLTSVTLPANTTVNGNLLFDKHPFLTIYCIGNEPSGISSFTDWNKTNENSNTLELFGSFSSNATKNEMDYAKVYTVESVDDILTLPSKEYPIFDFVKEKGQVGTATATLANYHYYGGRIKDQDGDTAIVMGSDLITNDTNDINSEYNSEYAVMLTNGHFRFEIPYQVYINGDWLNVGKIGKAALALQISNQFIHPRGDAPAENTCEPDSEPVKYWDPNENFWTMKEITVPHCINTIDDIAMAFVSFTTLRSYDSDALKTSADGRAKLFANSTQAPLDGLEVGKFPKSLTTIGKKAFVYSAITVAKLPSCLTLFGDVSTGAPGNNTYYYFPFMGCFELSQLEIYTVTGVSNPVFTIEEDSGVISHTTSKKIFGGAGAKESVTIPWGTTEVVPGALRGGRNIQHILFPYTLNKIRNNFLDTIGNARDKEGRSGQSNLKSVKFGGLASEYAGSTGSATVTVPKCTDIEKSAFYGCNMLEEVEFPVGLKTIGQWAFINCSSLNKISVDKGDTAGSTTPSAHLDFTDMPQLNSIQGESFKYCRGIEEITTSPALKSIAGGSAFLGCNHLETLNLDSATKTLANSCFQGCESLTNLAIPSDCNLGNSCFQGCTGLTSVSFSEGTNKNTLGNSAFNGCTNLETVTLNGITSIGASCFYNCTSLQSIEIPDSSTVNNLSFSGCTGLASGTGVIVGKGVKFTGITKNSAFFNCGSTTKIFLKDTYDEMINANAGNYPQGWNIYTTTGGNKPLTFYCYSATQPANPVPNFHYWEDEDHDGVPHIWQ